MAWCRVSSLTAAVARSLRDARFPQSRSKVLALVSGKNLEGWDLDYFLSRALRKRRYKDLKDVLSDLDAWIDAQS